MKKALLSVAILASMAIGGISTATAQQYDTIAYGALPNYLKGKSGEVTVVIKYVDIFDDYECKTDFGGKVNLIYGEGIRNISGPNDNDWLQSVTIPKSAKSVWGFRNCTSLKDVNFDRKYISRFHSTALYEDENGNVYEVYYGGISELPQDANYENTLYIDMKAFLGCPLQKSVYKSEGEISGHKFFNFDNNTKEIVVPGYLAFYISNSDYFSNLENLESLTFEADKDSDSTLIGVKYRGDCPEELIYTRPFWIIDNCPNLKRISLPENTIALGGFRNLPNLESLNIPSGVKYFGGIVDCPSLKTLNLPEGLINYHEDYSGKCKMMPLLYGNTALESVNIPKNLEIGILNDLDYSCDDNRNISIEETFSNCKSLKSIEIPEGVTYIGDYTFFNCESLTSIKLPSTLRTIGNYAFAHCKSLETIELPENLARIGDFAFEGCEKLTNINIPKSVSNGFVGKGAFWACSSLKQNLEPNKIIVDSREFEYWDKDVIINFTDEIPGNYFEDFTSLKSAIITHNNVKIGVHAFDNCIYLESLIAPLNVICEKDEYVCPFYNCFSLKKISNIELCRDIDYYFNEYEFIHDYLIDFQILFGKIKLQVYLGVDTYDDIYVPEHEPSRIQNKKAKFYVKEKFIDQYNQKMKEVNDSIIKMEKDKTPDKKSALYEYEFLSIEKHNKEIADQWTNGETVTIPEGVVYVPCSLFEGNTSIKKVILPKSLKVISERAFANCTNLTMVKGTENLVAIYDSAFEGCAKLSKIKIPKNTVLGEGVFKDSGKK